MPWLYYSADPRSIVVDPSINMQIAFQSSDQVNILPLKDTHSSRVPLLVD